MAVGIAFAAPAFPADIRLVADQAYRQARQDTREGAQTARRKRARRHTRRASRAGS